MKFTYNSRIIKHLGSELITSDEIALTELLKNSYDAHAQNISIQFLSSIGNLDESRMLISSVHPDIVNTISECDTGYNILLIEDNGSGMDRRTLTKGFFDIGTDIKVNEKNSLGKNDNIILGEKGIGRLSAQRIGPILIIETKHKDSDDIYCIEIEWEKFINNQTEEAPELTINDTSGDSYTRLEMVS